jgi:hypothetical protein
MSHAATRTKKATSEYQSGPTLTALSYLFLHEGNEIVARCPDLDIVATGKTREEAENRLRALLLYQVNQW